MKTALAAAVNTAASWYARRVWWADKADLVQEGGAAALPVAATWTGTPDDLRRYLSTVVQRAIANYCWRTGAPVHASRARALRGIVAAPVEAAPEATTEEDSPEGEIIAHEAASVRREAAEKVHAIAKIVVRSATRNDRKAAIAFLAGEDIPPGADMRTVYRVVAAVKSRARTDKTIREAANA